MNKCWMCGKRIVPSTSMCPYCGFDENSFEKDALGTTSKVDVVKIKKEKEPMFTQEQAFMMHIHPDDELYHKFMELDILSKNYD